MCSTCEFEYSSPRSLPLTLCVTRGCLVSWGVAVLTQGRLVVNRVDCCSRAPLVFVTGGVRALYTYSFGITLG